MRPQTANKPHGRTKEMAQVHRSTSLFVIEFPRSLPDFHLLNHCMGDQSEDRYTYSRNSEQKK